MSSLRNGFRSLFYLAMLSLVAGMVAGCSTPEMAENDSERPWNAPRNWEHGLPGFMNEGR
jgi:hypothetical protein